MSKTLGLAVLDAGYDQPRVPVMEHIFGIGRDAIVHFTGIDPVAERGRIAEAFDRLAEVFEIDLLWGGGLPGNDRTVYDWESGLDGVTSKDGHPMARWGIFAACSQEDGRHFLHVPKPESVEEALAFEPLEHFPDAVEQYRQRFQAAHDKMLERDGELLYGLPHHYTTAFHWPLACFGFEMLCMAGMEEDAFHTLMEKFVVITERITTAWSQVEGLRGFICHDDLAMTSGLIFPPDWYRRHITCFYPRLFKPLRDAGVPVIFTSDGDCSMLVDDIFEAGADGLNFEYMVDIDRLTSDWPDRILIGNISSAVLANGTEGQIEAEVSRCMRAGARARRFVVNVGGQITHTIPIANLEHYLRVRRKLAREIRNELRP